jgi:predicted aminopeptidase
VVWAVTASPQLKLESKLWSFPIVGSFPYLGWFQKEAAESYARKIEAEALAQGEPLDIDVRGAAAYSTLGWFPDPLLSSMIREGDEALGEWVEVLCHESFHATVYVNGQGAWNESLAQFVGEGIAEVYLRENYGESSREFQSYQNSRTRGAKIGVKLQAVYLALQTLYEGALSREEKLQTKSQILQELSAWWEKEFGRARLFNNASLVGYRTYGSSRTEMEEVLRRCGSDWGRLVQALSRIDRESFDRPHQDPFGSVLLKGVGPDCSSPTGR